MSDISKATARPWALEIREGGPLTGVEAEIAEMQDCEAYAYTQMWIASPSEPTGGKRRNPETGAFDIPVPRVIATITFDPRDKVAAAKARADAALIVRAVNRDHAFDAMKEALRAIEQAGRIPDSAHANCCAEIARAALAKGESQ